ADGQRRSVRLDDTLAMQITAILGRGGMPYAELYKRLSERRKEMPSRSALRTFIRRHNQLTATMRRSTGAPGVNQEMFVSLPGEPVPPHAVQSAAAQPHTERTSWRDDARCRDTDPDYFFEERADAQRFCAGCSVNGPCFQFAAASGQEFGIWGLNKNRRDILLSKLPDWVLGELYPDTISNKQLLRATTSG
ncbi:MAG TPA: WhiB family transcriptional regulator, partial [Candidatus Saccharimonadales bacterium]|nr:WhiB family transcriptional regulator [Candidatus Saccharimonadales bacterium]